MAIFGDVNDNRVIPLILMSGIIFLAGMYVFYIYRWVRNFLNGGKIASSSSSSGSEETIDDFPLDSFMTTITDLDRRQSMQWDMDSTVVIFQPSIKVVPEHFE